jgi:F-type H+-transporting ATPase subunit gamma
MASLKDIRIRIDSTKNTQQITKAMKLVSTAKLRKAQNNVVNLRPYALALRELIADIATTEKVSHPLMQQRSSVQKLLIVVLGSDRGLCGGFNAGINKFVENFMKTEAKIFEKVDYIFIGRRVNDYFNRRNVTPIDYITRLDKDISYELASKISSRIMKEYLAGGYDEVRIVHNEFKSAISQIVRSEKLLPIDIQLSSFHHQSEKVAGFSKDFIYEPSPEEMIQQLLVKHFDLQVYRTMSESVASEHGARMTAMENASNNAKAMIESLTLTYNKLRQEKITTELIEITSGAEALK